MHYEKSKTLFFAILLLIKKFLQILSGGAFFSNREGDLSILELIMSNDIKKN